MPIRRLASPPFDFADLSMRLFEERQARLNVEINAALIECGMTPHHEATGTGLDGRVFASSSQAIDPTILPHERESR